MAVRPDPDGVPPPRGHRQRQRTRVALLSAGQRLFAVQNPDGVSIDDIVQDAAVSKGSFYNHFDDKEAFSAAIRELVQGDLEFHVTSANRDVADPAERIVRALCVVMRYAADHPDRLQALLSLSERRTTAESPLNAGIRADIRDGIAGNRLTVADIETGVLTVLGLILVTVRHAMSDETSTPPARLAARMGATLLAALGAPAGECIALAKAAASQIVR